jgi:hypothetical protein
MYCICWFFAHILLGIVIVKELTARRLYKSFGVKGLFYLLDGGGCVRQPWENSWPPNDLLCCFFAAALLMTV